MVTRRKRRSVAVPEQPSGSLAIQIPPEKAEPASMGNVLMMVVPMLGSTGVMVFMALQNNGNSRSMLMGGGLLVVSQFTLYGDCRKGKRPSFDKAAGAEMANAYYEKFVAGARAKGLSVGTGKFQAHMLVSLVNNGPVTILLDSKKNF